MKTKILWPALAFLMVMTFHAKADDWLDVMARRILASLDEGCNRDRLARAILCRTHPSGTNPSVTLVQVFRTQDWAANCEALTIQVTLNWNGGLTGCGYTTVVSWRVNAGRHLRASLTFDDAVIPVSAANKLRLNTYFQEVFEILFPAERH